MRAFGFVGPHVGMVRLRLQKHECHRQSPLVCLQALAKLHIVLEIINLFSE